MTDTSEPLAWLDLALVYDPAAKHADCEIGDDGDLLFDETPITPMLISLGSDRRALDDDILPTGEDFFSRGSGGYGARRGAVGDILDGEARRCGSRLWLLDREKQDEPDPDLTRRRAQAYLEEAFDWVRVETGRAAVITTEWARRGVLRFKVAIGDTNLSIARLLGGVA
jgi:phage gp46-like protein